MQVLITGGAGFIGSHLVDRLIAETDASLIVLDDFSTGRQTNLSQVPDDRLTVRERDIQDRDATTRAVRDADIVYHLAAAVGVKMVVGNPLESLRTNINGTENVLNAAARDGTPTFVASSSEVYGKSTSVPYTEDDNRVLGPTTSPRWSYATSKAADEFLALGYHQEYELPVVVGRFFNIVGPRQSGQYGMVVPIFVKQALAGDPLTIYGDGEQTRSFAHVKDAVVAVHELMREPDAVGEVFNIGPPSSVSINTLATRVIEIAGSSSETMHLSPEEVYGDDFEDPDRRVPDVSKLRDTLGWAPNADLNAILEDVVAEHREKRK